MRRRTINLCLVAAVVGGDAAFPSAQHGRTQHEPHPAGDPAHQAAAPQHGEPQMRHRGPADHSFADAEAWAERFEGPDRDQWQMPERVVEALALEPGMTVADIGSGTGYFARSFAAAVGTTGTVFATDVEPSMAEYVRKRADEDGQANLIPVLASYDDPRLPDRSVDLAFICNTWHHIHDRVDYARRLAGDLRPGGRIAIVDFLPGELPVGPGPEHKLSAGEVTAELEAAGYRLAASPEFLPYQYLLVFERSSSGSDSP